MFDSSDRLKAPHEPLLDILTPTDSTGTGEIRIPTAKGLPVA